MRRVDQDHVAIEKKCVGLVVNHKSGIKKNDSSKNRREICIADTFPCFPESQFHRNMPWFSPPQLLFIPLKYQDVAVDRHTDRKDKSRNTREREGNRDKPV